jgi:hypothetical protein
MSSTKQISTGSYYIDTLVNRGNPNGNIYLTTRDFVIDANLIVLGSNSTSLTTATIFLQKSTSLPPVSVGNVVITSNTAGVGESGLYTNPDIGKTPSELATVISARKYALIFG